MADDIIRKKGFRGGYEVVGHIDDNNKIREKDGILSKGKELGYIDKDSKVRKKDGFFSKGDEVGKIENNEAFGKDGFLTKGEKWGYIDEQGNVRQRDGFLTKGRIVGTMRSNDTERGLGYFMLQFDKLRNDVEQLASEVESSENKCWFNNKVKFMENRIDTANAIGDFDKLKRTLNELKKTIEVQLGDNLCKKKLIVREAQDLANSKEWKITTDRFKVLKEQWNAIGPVEKEKTQQIWDEFNGYQQRFFQNKKEYFARLKIEQERISQQKRRLIRDVRELSNTSDWNRAKDKVKEISEQFKITGFAGKEENQKLWEEFTEARTLFYDRYGEYKEKKNEQWKVNQRSYLRENIEKKRSYKYTLEERIRNDESAISDHRTELYNTSTYGKKKYHEKVIASKEENISSKRDKLRELQNEIYDLQRKLDDIS